MSAFPRPLGTSAVVLSDDERRRLKRFIARIGFGNALRELAIGEHTLCAARDEGRVQKATRDRLLERLTAAELALAAPPEPS